MKSSKKKKRVLSEIYCLKMTKYSQRDEEKNIQYTKNTRSKDFLFSPIRLPLFIWINRLSLYFYP